jgi:hypothetical protein
MFQKRFMLCACATVLALALACSKQSTTPVSPSSSGNGGVDAAADGSTLKVAAPTVVSPVNGAQPDTVVLTANKVAGKFADIAPSYEFEIKNAAGTTVYSSGAIATVAGTTVSNTPPATTFDFDTPYTWRVRAVLSGANGPWSAAASFRSAVGGYVRGNEVFDPLTNGPSKVINASNDVTWLPGIGVRLNSKESYVEWKLPQTCTDCEFSAMMTNLGNGSEEWKTKVMSMLEAGVNTTDNRYRVTIDKRTTWVGQGSRIRYTMCSGNTSGQCQEPVTGFQSWDRSKTYFWKFEWRGGVARLFVNQDGKNGPPMPGTAGGLAISYKAPYNPNPHLVRLGSVGGRADPETNPGTIVWNAWVSPNPRPNLPGDK